MTDYEPGTVAVATVRGVPNVRVQWSSCQGWSSVDLVSGSLWHEPDDVTDVRPLVVLDLYNSLTMQDVCRALRADGYGNVANQIEAQTKPPRIPEPGLWGVVRASFGGHSTTREFVRYPDGWRGDAYEPVAWDDLHDPEPIREGVES